MSDGEAVGSRGFLVSVECSRESLSKTVFRMYLKGKEGNSVSRGRFYCHLQVSYVDDPWEPIFLCSPFAFPLMSTMLHHISNNKNAIYAM